MISVAFGLGTALSWATATLLLAGAAREVGPFRFALLFLRYQTLVIMPLGIAAAIVEPWSVSELWPIALAGVVQAGGLLAYGRALRLSPVGVASAIASLEGVVAAGIAIALGEHFGGLTGLGLVLAALGGLLLGLAARDSARASGVGFALITAVSFGIGLWVIDDTQLPNLLTLFVFNLVASVAMTALQAARPPEGPRTVGATLPLLAAGAASVGGYVLFAIGADQGSLAITAVLASQFAVLAAIGSYLLLGEALSRVQMISLALLAAGVAAVTLGTS